MKISNELKIGVIAVISITLLFLGFNFLKGKEVFSKSTTLYGVYSNVQGLTASNQVIINGLQVGTVSALTPSKDMKSILVTMSISKDINIPSNSIALIKSNPITNANIEIKLGDASSYLKDKDTILTEANASLLDELMKEVDPVLYEVKKAAKSLDTLLSNINSILDVRTKTNITEISENLKTLSVSLNQSTASLNEMLNSESGSVAKTMKNINAFTGNLAANNNRINSMLANMDSTSANLARLDLQQTLLSIDTALAALGSTINKINSDSGTVGRLMNDPSLYNNLSSTSNKINVLLDDIRLHPKRYLSFPLIGGKKKKADPLMQPLPDTLNAPYSNK